MRQYAYFDELPVKTHFVVNGNRWIKKSKTTAFLPEFNRWFYFNRKDLCVVGLHSRISA